MRVRERGATAVIVAILLAVLCGFVAMSLDVGHLFSVRGELQNGADAGALAGARRLSGRNQNFELQGAVSDARTYARNHPTDRYDVEPSTIELGRWVPPGGGSCGDFGGTPVGDPGPDGSFFCAIAGREETDAANINAVRVVTARSGAAGEAAGGGAVELAFGSFVGHAAPAEVGAEAIALAGGPPSESCPDLPIAIRAGCLYEDGKLACDESGWGKKPFFVGLGAAPADSAGLTSLSDDPASARRICDIAQGTCVPLRENVEIEIQEGTSWEANCDNGCSARDYRGSPTPGDSICEVIRRMADADCDGAVDLGPDGRPARRHRVPVVQYPGESLRDCGPGDHYNQQAKIVGWATVAVISARCESIGPNQNQLPVGQVPITAACDEYLRTNPTSGDTCIAIRHFCEEQNDEQTGVGGGWFGTTTMQPVLVR